MNNLQRLLGIFAIAMLAAFLSGCERTPKEYKAEKLTCNIGGTENSFDPVYDINKYQNYISFIYKDTRYRIGPTLACMVSESTHSSKKF